MKLITTLVIAAALLTAGASYALADGDAQYEYVTKVNVGPDNYVYINVAGNFSYSHGCSRPWFVRTNYQLTDERAKAQMRIAMASFLSKKKVWVWTQGCTPYGYPIMTKIQLQQD